MEQTTFSKDVSTHLQFRNPSGTPHPIDEPAWTKSVYLTGKITGLWYPYVWLKFNLYEIYLAFFGYKVWNPIRQLNRKLPYLNCYLSRGRSAYLEMIKTIKPSSDFVVDGSLSVDNIVYQIMGQI